ncbi:MAG: type IV pilin N-terminal domain-containing protein [Methanohalobium sp.]|uniref:type IV pilin N-terminal domain-containing protein n=1 Tax=Methanohalobium sp. TaxID=2837493 RepID=UPI0039794848
MKIQKNSKSLIENSDAVTEVVGEILMTAIDVLAFSLISIFVFSYLDTIDKPHVDVEGWVDVDSDIINLRHSGGEVVETKDIKLILNLNGSREEIDVESVYNEPTWRLGDFISINTSSKWNLNIKGNQYIESTIVHTKSNVVIENGILLSEEYKDGGIEGPTFPPGDNQSDYVEYVDDSVETSSGGSSNGSQGNKNRLSFNFSVTDGINVTITDVELKGNDIDKFWINSDKINNNDLPANVNGNNNIEIQEEGNSRFADDYEKDENESDINIIFLFNDSSSKSFYFKEE